MKRKDALNVIRVEVAQNGEITKHALRVYIEHRISRKVFNDTVRRGFAIYHAGQKS